MSPDDPFLLRLDAVMDDAAQAGTGLSKRIEAEVRAGWKDALTASVDYAALGVDPEPDDAEVAAVAESNRRAAFLAAVVMLMFLGSSEADAFAIVGRLGEPQSIAGPAVRARLRQLRTVINTRIAERFAVLIGEGTPRQVALDKAVNEALTSTGIFNELEALQSVNVGINEVGAFLSKEGLVVTKTWYTRRDTLVREAHARAESQEVPFNSSFSVGGWPMEFPGDTRAPLSLWANCRCIMVVGSPSVLSSRISTP